MAESDGESEPIAGLERSISADETVLFAVAFGSQVDGDPTEGSDLDLAVKFVDELSASERFRQRCRLSGELQRDGWPFVDVVDVESLPLDVTHDAVGGRLLCGDSGAFESFERSVETEFAERREEIRTRRRRVIDRIAEQGLRG